MSNPKISVIVPVYGVEKYIERCARSLFEQTLDDIEFLFIDDCSPDKSIEVLKKVLENYPHRKHQIVLHRMEHNSGQAAVREWGIKNATGDYIIHCDSDDWVDVRMYETLYNKAVEEDADIVICDFVHAYSDGRRIVMPQKPAAQDGKTLIHQMLFQQLHGSCCNKLVRRACYKEDVVFPKENMREDLALMVQLAYYSHRIVYEPQALYNYYFNASSISQALTYNIIESRVKQSVKNYQIIEDFIKGKGLLDEFAKGLTMVKFKIKNELALNTGDIRGRKLWDTLFTDITIWEVLKLKTEPVRKLRFILASVGAYTIAKKIQKVFKS